MNQQLVTKSMRSTSIRIGELAFAILGSLPISFPFLVTAWLLVTIPDRYQAEVDFRSRALLTSGIVADRRENTYCSVSGSLSISCTSSCNLKVKFTSNRKIVEFWTSCYESASENQVVPVLYDPTDIGKVRIDRGETPESLARGQFILSMFIGLLGIGSLTYFSRTENSQKRS